MGKDLELALGITEPLDFITESSAILGKKGSGKTSSGVVIVEEVFKQHVPFVVVDPKGDWYGLRSSADGAPGIPVPIFGGLHGDVPLEPTAGKYIAHLLRERGLSAILDVSEFSIGERAKFLTPFADGLYRFDSKQPTLLVLEEAHEYIPQQTGPDGKRMLGNFERLVKLGRWKGLGVLMMSQRSASLNKNVLTQVDNLFVMKTTSPQDRAAIKLWIDTAADGGRDILSTLPSLETGTAWLWQPSRGEPVNFRFRMRWTYDAGATPVVGAAPRPAATLADVDLGVIATAMAETIEKAKADDPTELRKRIRDLERVIADKVYDKPEPVEVRIEVPVEMSVLTDDDRKRIVDLIDMLEPIAGAIDTTSQSLVAAMDRVQGNVSLAPVTPMKKPTPHERMTPRPQVFSPEILRAADEAVWSADLPPLRTGARRMVETLGRMYPLHLTKSQWGTVSGLKTSGGTWSTYLSDIRKRGLIVEDSAGWTLTDAGFDYIGGRPAPMTAAELQDHYRTILRSGAVRMLDEIMEVWPDGLTRQELAFRTDMTATGGTFATYVSDLTRNGLVEKNGDTLFATDILMKGANA